MGMGEQRQTTWIGHLLVLVLKDRVSRRVVLYFVPYCVIPTTRYAVWGFMLLIVGSRLGEIDSYGEGGNVPDDGDACGV